MTDPEPLAVLTPIPRRLGMKARKAAEQWASEHQTARGYIEIPMGDGGYFFFKVRRGGLVSVSSADECQPNLFLAQDTARRVHRDARQRFLKHPRCPYCQCMRDLK